jgi:diguanylate cyclase (GGDEF)-like protein
MPTSLAKLHRRALALILAALLVAGAAGYLLHADVRADPAGASVSLLSGLRPAYLLIVLCCFATVIVTSLRLRRRVVRAVRHDIKSLVRMFKDVRDGSVRVDYPMKLADFSEGFQYLRDSGRILVAEKEQLKDMGLMDHLSQLGNRRHFEMRLKELFELSKTHGVSSVLIIDMDKFKAVNDNHGHDAGDALITGFARALRRHVRQSDVLARLGGDEFCIIYTYVAMDNAIQLAERLRRQLPREIPLIKGIIHELRWTGGLSVMHEKDAKFDDVLWRADQAMLQAKEAGRNVTRAYDPAVGLAKKEIMPS